MQVPEFVECNMVYLLNNYRVVSCTPFDDLTISLAYHPFPFMVTTILELTQSESHLIKQYASYRRNYHYPRGLSSKQLAIFTMLHSIIHIKCYSEIEFA